MQSQIVRGDCVYTKASLAAALGVSPDTLDRILLELGVRPVRARTKTPLISGTTFRQAVEARAAQQ